MMKNRRVHLAMTEQEKKVVAQASNIKGHLSEVQATLDGKYFGPNASANLEEAKRRGMTPIPVPVFPDSGSGSD